MSRRGVALALGRHSASVGQTVECRQLKNLDPELEVYDFDAAKLRIPAGTSLKLMH